ncbi:MAG: hypothetical protein GF307_04710 [candidate division Zixibacteria bacterium]|nr:hypothetical protein [candidate division Zixibacteria bacterium]
MHIINFRKSLSTFILLIAAFTAISCFNGCTKEKTVVYRELERPGAITKISPVNGDTIRTSPATLVWKSLDEAASYQVQVDNYYSFQSIIIDTTVTDTSWTMPSDMDDDRYYWRVRAKNQNDVWGDWSDESVWDFLYNVLPSPVSLVSQTYTYGYAQDVFVVNSRNRAYVADGQAGMTILDITSKSSPDIIANMAEVQENDFAQGIYIAPGDSFAYVADMDGKIPVFSIKEPFDSIPYVGNLGQHQNTEDITGRIINDSLYVIAVSSSSRRMVQFYPVPYDSLYGPILNWFRFQTYMVSDCNGLDFLQNDSNYLAVAANELGLQILDISGLPAYETPPQPVGWVDFPGKALSVFVRDTIAYVAADREGLWICNVSSATAPDTISNFNTAGRSKDVVVVDSFAFIADGADGLKIANISDPANPTFVAAHDTPYAYGIWGDENYIYLTDRDWGLLIFAYEP